ncbi:HNH endonuclease signature motif containing protein [Microbacterium sp. ASV81]|uniref:DUF222 domain-containing protein n=1 Tax=Microbacterium capsulatum TaxID=3041921 RepID=A0ABU0XDK6_9MICO|nr:DUF222 domain-containing protein [Microbacterium sp. ASV81]MDQ4213163.1 DUF222 domain-containing protein [Microbacterium sp. ASV81]
MELFTEVEAQLRVLRELLGDAIDPAELVTRMENLSDDESLRAISAATALIRCGEQIRVVGAALVAARSSRESGHAGLAQSRGHRNAVALVQDLTGVTKIEAARQVRVGEALRDVAHTPPDARGVGGVDDAPADPAPPWHAALGRALLDGLISTAQHDSIRRGLGEPIEGAEEAWAQAADQLTVEAGRRTVEELLAHARTIRDLIDAEGAETRFLARYERRSFRTYLDQDGMRRASIAFDDEGGALVDTMFAAALRPRRGGPRFVDPDEKSVAEDLTADPRTNDQLAYDLLLDLIRAGALAEPEAVFGTRQAGLRLVQVVDRDGAAAPLVHTEDGVTALPAAIGERRVCEAGIVSVSVDCGGNPLDVGRESRLFTPRQRVALAVRDGGCRWDGCDRPASYCEAHHIDEWERDRGRTDVDRGILLCRFHHMELHHGGWRITRDGTGDFVLHRHDGRTLVLRHRLPLRYAWGDIDPPPRRFRPAA